MMENPKTTRVLRLVLMLCGARTYSLDELKTRLDVSERTLYRDLDTLKSVGFDVECRSGRYRILPSPPTNSAMVVMKQLDNDKLQYQIEEHPKQVHEHIAPYRGHKSSTDTKKESIQSLLHLVKMTWGAIDRQVSVKLHDYRSNHSGTTADRLVEPFSFSPEKQCIWAFEPASGMCKQFKITRLSRITVLEEGWKYAHKHQLPFTDIFNISAPEPIDTLEMELNLNAYNLFLEEYPAGRDNIMRKDPYVLRLEVAGYEGVGRFVLGLLGDIKVRRSKAFIKYLNAVIERFRN